MMNNKYKYMTATIVLISTIMFAGCSDSAATSKAAEQSMISTTVANSENSSSDKDSTVTGTSVSSGENVEEVTEVEYKKADINTDWQEEDYSTIEFTDLKVKADDSVETDGTAVTIKKAGTYVVKGKCADGQIIIDVADDEKVWLVFDGIDLTGRSGAPVYVKQADKVTITLEEDTDNVISDTAKEKSDESSEDDEEPTAAIYSESSLSINGTGSLTVNGNNNDGITSKKKLKICGGYITVNATDDGVYGKNLFAMNDGTLTVVASDEGIKAKKNLVIDGGTINVTCTEKGHGLTAAYYLRINDGDITVKQSYEGFEATYITVNGGNIDITSSDDGMNSTASASSDSSSSSAVKSDENMSKMQDRNASKGGRQMGNPPEMPNGERPDGGMPDMTGGNASGAAVGMGGRMRGGFGGGMPGDNDGSSLTINGGNITINAEGDGLDSNGTLAVNGGTVIVNGPVSGGNGVLDYGTSFELSGGTLIAAGSADMPAYPTKNSQGYITYTFDSSVKAGAVVTLKNEEGKEVISYKTLKNIQYIFISTKGFDKDSAYSIFVDGNKVGDASVK